MQITKILRAVSVFTLAFLTACSGSGLKYEPTTRLNLRTVPSSESVSLPSSTLLARCLTEIDPNLAKPVSDILALYCAHINTEDTANSEVQRLIKAGSHVAARLAYDTKTNSFQTCDLAPNVRIVPKFPSQGTYRFAQDFRVKERTDNALIGEGGVALIRKQETRDIENLHHYPPEGLFEPVNLSVETRRSAQADLIVTLHMADRTDLIGTDTANAAGQAYLHLLEDAQLKKVSTLGFFNAVKFTSHKDGIYMIEPFDPNRIPVLMVHGLRSNPLIWRELTLQILTTPYLHKHLQVWHAFYPTGIPPFYAASRMRSNLKTLLKEIDPEEESIAYKHMALIGHSMGGLISRMLVTNDNGAIWNRTFTVAPEDIDIEPDRKAKIENLLTLKAEPQIGFAAFINTPHRGSDVASSFIGRLGSALINLPYTFKELFATDQRMLQYATEDMRPFISGGGPDSVKVLRPGTPLLSTLADLPITDGVKIVSVVGVKKGESCVIDTECKASDGVVSYDSAHLPFAEEEIIIQSAHDGYNHPDTIEFLSKHLRDWLSELQAAE